MMEKVSLLIPVYGVEKYIEKCACSLFEQTYGNIEFIFVDDCTKDRSMEVLQDTLDRYPLRKSQVKIVRHKENRGLAAARNTALDQVSGIYLMHVDSDDYLEKNAVELLIGKAMATQADIVVCDSNTVYEHKVSRSFCKLPVSKEEYIKSMLVKSIPASIWGKLFSTRFYRSSGIRSVEGLNHGEDYVTVPRLIFWASRIVKLDAALYNYVQYNQGAYTKNITRKSVDDIVWADKILTDFFIPFPEYKEVLIRMKARSKLSLLKMGSIKIYDYVTSAFPDTGKEYSSCVSLKDRVLLFLVNRRFYHIASLYSRAGLWLKNCKGIN